MKLISMRIFVAFLVFDTNKSQPIKNNFANGYTTGDFTRHTNVNDGQAFGGSVYQKVKREVKAIKCVYVCIYLYFSCIQSQSICILHYRKKKEKLVKSRNCNLIVASNVMTRVLLYFVVTAQMY